MIPRSFGTLVQNQFTDFKKTMEDSPTNKRKRSTTSIKIKRKLNVNDSGGSDSQAITPFLPPNANKINNTDENPKKKFCRKVYDPQKKYGIDIPSYDDILKDQENCRDYKKAFQSLADLTAKLDGDDNFRPKPSYNASSRMLAISPVTTNINNMDKHIKRKSGRKIYDASKKYSMDIPSYDDILKDKKNCQDYKKSVQSLTHFIISTLEDDDNFRPKRNDISQTSSIRTSSPITNKINSTGKHIEKRSCRKLYDPSKKYNIDVPSYEDFLSNTHFQRNKRQNTNDHIKQNENDEIENRTGESYESFQKYGMCIPSYEDILRDKKNCDNYSNFVKSLTRLTTSVSKIKINTLENRSLKVEVPNCKHMSNTAIISALERNFRYLDDIHKEKVYCERHERYKTLVSRNGLIYSTSMIAFTNEQKQLLVMELSKYYKDSDYYFKVLLPELCLKIFMDEYSMTRDEATECMSCY